MKNKTMMNDHDDGDDDGDGVKRKIRMKEMEIGMT